MPLSPPSAYLTDVPYPVHFQREAMPVWMTLMANLLGYQGPDLTQPYRWCEFGCGQGLTALMAAATNPNGQFVGIDLNPRHVQQAQQLAKAAALENLHFVSADLGQLAQTDAAIPSVLEEGFDFIVLNGLYSWVSAQERHAIRILIQRYLKPGGLVYLGYMCQPGMAFLSGLRSLLYQHAQSFPGNSAQRVSAALALLEAMAAAGAGFFVEQPKAMDYLRRARQQDPAYLAHELLNPHWEPLAVAQVIGELQQDCGCTYLGSATPLENQEELSIPSNLLALLEPLRMSAERESFKDLARNQSERRDLYQRGAQALPHSVLSPVVLDWVMTALPEMPHHGPLRFDTRIGPLTGPEPLFSEVLALLQAGPCRVGDWLSLPSLRQHPSLLEPTLSLLLWAGYIHPLLPGSIGQNSSRALNQVLSECSLHGMHWGYIAAPTLGSALTASTLQMALVRILLDYPRLQGPLLLETLRALRRDCNQVPHEDDSNQLPRLEQYHRPLWQQIGIL